MRGKTVRCFIIVAVACMFFLAGGRFDAAQAAILLMDGRLIVSGFIKETAFIRTTMWDREKFYQDSRMDFLQTSALLETQYNLLDEQDRKISLFVGVRGWWQKSQYFDSSYRDSIPSLDRKQWVRPRRFMDDVITEAYVDYYNGPLQVRAGKQIAIWGQLNLERVADVVNPMDFRLGFPGLNTWEEVKQGLWMLRVMYQTDLPGTLMFETIINPGDFKQFEALLEGAQPGVNAYNNRFFDPKNQKYGIYHWQRRKWTSDAPGWHRSNWELGFRLTGYTYGVDWSLLYWNARDDGPIAKPGRVNQYTMPYIISGIRTAIRGRWVEPSSMSARVFSYKRYTTLGGTAQLYAPVLWNTVWRFEWFTELNRPMNKAVRGDQRDIYGTTRRNIVGAALQCSKTLNIPGFTNTRIANNSMLEVDLTYGYERVLNHNKDLALSHLRGYYYKSAVNDVVTLFMRQSLYQGKFMFVFVGNYFFRSTRWMAIPSLSYMLPGSHWRFDLGYVARGCSGRKYAYEYFSSPSNDHVVLRLRFEF